MRLSLVALALAPLALALPVDTLESRNLLFRPGSSDPMAIHKRSVPSSDIAPAKRQPIDHPASSPSYSSSSDEEDEPCASICTQTWLVQSSSSEDALCTSVGLHATLQCARCIDLAWPETSWEDSALAEYERIKSACAAGPQHSNWVIKESF